jgi:outer membrane protein assembly factor BamA
MKTIPQLAFVGVLFALLVFYPPLSLSSVTYSRVELSGNEKTDAQSIYNILGISDDTPISKEQLQLGMYRLAKTGVFTNITLAESEDNQVHQGEITVSEKWTTIPIFKISSGGGISHITAGVYDPNAFGQLVELGFQVERLGSTHSQVAWFMNDHLFGPGKGLNIQAWNINRLRTFYDPKEKSPIESNGYLLSRQHLKLGWVQELSRKERLHFGLQLRLDTFSDDLVPEAIPKTQVVLPIEQNHAIITASYNYDATGTETVYLNGINFNLDWAYFNGHTASSQDYHQITADFQGYKSIGALTLAQRIKLGHANSSHMGNQFFIGGLDSLRGFSDNRFYGNAFALSNTEIRYGAYTSKHIIGQVVAFYDMASVNNDVQNLNTIAGSSIGVGLRVIAPKVYRLVGRIDLSVPVVNSDDKVLSFGVQQFF